MGMMKKMLKKFGHHGEDDHEMESMDKYSMDDDDFSGFAKFFASMKESNKGRYRRDAALYDLGDKLVEKLEMAQEAFEAKAGNISCYLQEFGYIDEDMNLDLQGMPKEWDSYDWSGNPWLQEKSKQGVQDCYDMVMAMPTQILEMMMCLDMHKKMECMCNDAKQMLEKHFKPLPELVQETGMDEMTLLKLTHMLVEDSMDM